MFINNFYIRLFINFLDKLMKALLQKIFTSTFILAVSFLNLHAQEDRQNKDLPKISKTTLWNLTEATGWVRTPDGQWLSERNKIKSYHVKSSDLGAFNKWPNILGLDNFTSWSATNIIIEGKEFLLITKVLTTGNYKYSIPSASTFFTEKKTVFMVMKKNSAKFENSEYGYGPNYSIPLYYFGEVLTGLNQNSDIAAKINEMAAKNPGIIDSEGTVQSFFIYFVTLKDPSKCRFFALNSSEGDNRLRFLLPNIEFFNPGENVIFKGAYFELPTSQMIGLINLIKSK